MRVLSAMMMFELICVQNKPMPYGRCNSLRVTSYYFYGNSWSLKATVGLPEVDELGTSSH